MPSIARARRGSRPTGPGHDLVVAIPPAYDRLLTTHTPTTSGGRCVKDARHLRRRDAARARRRLLGPGAVRGHGPPPPGGGGRASAVAASTSSRCTRPPRRPQALGHAARLPSRTSWSSSGARSTASSTSRRSAPRRSRAGWRPSRRCARRPASTTPSCRSRSHDLEAEARRARPATSRASSRRRPRDVPSQRKDRDPCSRPSRQPHAVAAGRGAILPARRPLGRFPERRDVIDGALCAVLAGEHVLLLGPPGTAKSALVRAIAQAFGGSYFERLLTKFSTPEELFGPVRLKALEQDRYARVSRASCPRPSSPSSTRSSRRTAPS